MELDCCLSLFNALLKVHFWSFFGSCFHCGNQIRRKRTFRLTENLQVTYNRLKFSQTMVKQKVNTISRRISTSKRDDKWLLSRLDHLWTNFFTDVTQVNPVFIGFGRFSKFRLGSIRLEKTTKRSYITITGMFKDEAIPVEVVDQTIAHELCHYAHGFSSPKPRLHKYPHEGGIIKKELKRRGLEYLIKAYGKWLREYRKTL
ncbi:MAG: hypothetical protein US86_C0004G0010 [Candidatus Daviesbacteria bacterium GW2011_GWA2_38_24]|uniref:SprT-like domain-containing protein n=1 Tax=Candidatus Daviesbacteria bacterium GW2011_GWA2_38_24 TaxID=1618422 RepID=A0A0G0JIU9_9BACT|nr:MAG: hypothetical protein US86_C0004G0010 [Candidatus Daviesbacteria bacterium GW2011_GWA2_38_24]